MGLIEAIILAIIEGLTEYIPVSSTGHMIIASTFMGIQAEPFVKLFTVCIQLGAIMAVVILYFKNFFKTVDFYYKLFIAFLPAVVLGVLLKSTIDRMLESVLVVAVSLIAGGIILVFIDRIYHPNKAKAEGKITYKNALIIGILQTISMIPGVSRSAASIIGGMSQGLSRKAAAEFSFFLAVPTMFGATAKSMFDYFDDGGTILPEQWKILIAGNVVALIVSVIAIRFMMNILNTFGFKYFGYYRIAAGAFILILYFTGTNMVLID